ncbi:PfkB family carbohydrate kinase [Acidimangrovimonas sediminis]|uniref:PfkB family carbohydrate kinase n=1 Tax=Acidimangrovimonas sediminis TaxID=2056283 RepID=UPI000C80E196|nr:PfkB family carbohydrate kinase [Acidimangrovimonas sediminis]
MATVRDPERIARVAPFCFLMSFSGGELDQAEALGLARSVRAHGAENVLVTRGGEGELMLNGEGLCQVPAQPTDLHDSLGAGDTFIARVLVGLLKGESTEVLLRAAAIEAAMTCTRPGAFGHAAPMQIDQSRAMSLEEIYRVSQPAQA